MIYVLCRGGQPKLVCGPLVQKMPKILILWVKFLQKTEQKHPKYRKITKFQNFFEPVGQGLATSGIVLKIQ
jgi:hypothetical protein